MARARVAYKPVSPARAMFESTARTAVSMGVGALLTWAATWAAAQGFDFNPSGEMEVVLTGLAWTVLSSAYAAVQRKFVPIQTDRQGAGRTDLPETPTTAVQDPFRPAQ